MDARRAKSDLGWLPAETFEGGLRKTVQWYLANMAWVSSVSTGAYRTWVDLNYSARGAA
jgi:dTDP-glucose 4,6-dehydratase